PRRASVETAPGSLDLHERVKIRIERRTERGEERADLPLGAETAHGDLLGARDADPAQLLHERLLLLGQRARGRHPAFRDRDDQDVAGIRFVDFIVREIFAERRNDRSEERRVGKECKSGWALESWTI